MTKPMLGLVLGGVLGVFDGLSALVSAPNDPKIKAGIVGIVIGSTVKGLIAGAADRMVREADAVARPAAIVFGLAVGLALAFCVSLDAEDGGRARLLLADHAARRDPRRDRRLRDVHAGKPRMS